MANNKESLSKIVRISIYLAVVIFVVSILALLSKIFSSQELLIQIMAVVLSVVFTAVVTNTLLTGQTEDEEKKEKNSKVFEKKLTIYQEFLSKLCDVIKDDVVTKQEAVELEFATSYIVMHMDDKAARQVVIEKVCTLIGGIGPGIIGNSTKSSHTEILFTIVSKFKEDLYRTTDSIDEESIKIFEKTVSALDGQVDSEVSSNRATIDTQSGVAIKNMKSIIDEVIKKIGEGWQGEINSDNPLGFVLHKGDCEDLSFYVHCDPAYYFQLHIGNSDYGYEVYEAMKKEFGGRRNNWSWWQYMEPVYREKNDFLNLLETGDKAFISYLVNQTVERIKYFGSLM